MKTTYIYKHTDIQFADICTTNSYRRTNHPTISLLTEYTGDHGLIPKTSITSAYLSVVIIINIFSVCY